MKKFYLLSKVGDIIYKLDAANKEQAVKLFSIVKRLSKEDLLKIFIVTDQV